MSGKPSNTSLSWGNATSPLTNQELKNTEFFPIILVKNLIDSLTPIFTSLISATINPKQNLDSRQFCPFTQSTQNVKGGYPATEQSHLF